MKRLLLALAALAVAPLVANALAAAGERAWYGSPIQEGRETALYTTIPDPHDPHQRGRLALAPGSAIRGLGQQVSINSLGLRGPELSPEKRGPRVWCAGGGTVYDIFSPSDAETWPGQLQSILQARGVEGAEVINAGVPGEVLIGSMDAFEAQAASVRPDALVLYHGPNDLRAVLFMRDAGPPLEGAPLPDLALFRLWGRLRPTPPIADTGQRLQPYHLDDLRRRLETALRRARALDVPVVLATHAMRAPLDGAPTWDQMAEEATLLGLGPADTARLFDDWNGLVADLARRERLPFADVRAAVGDAPAAWGDAIHFAPEGSRQTAEVVAEVLLSEGLLE